MKYVILRDDDTNALTPIDCLERLYRPFLDRDLPVNLAVIPNVRTHVTYGDNVLEGFLVYRKDAGKTFVPIGENQELVRYLRGNTGFHIAQHGCHHEFINGQCEFEQTDRADVNRRLEMGKQMLMEAGFPEPETFVAPYDRFTRVSIAEVAERFSVISTSWFELRRLPVEWWPRYALKKLERAPHWRANGTLLLSHPPCYLSYHRPYDRILDQIRQSVADRRLTVLVTHWWEFFRNGIADEALIDVLHATADFLASERDLKVISFADVAANPERYL